MVHGTAALTPSLTECAACIAYLMQASDLQELVAGLVCLGDSLLAGESRWPGTCFVQ